MTIKHLLTLNSKQLWKVICRVPEEDLFLTPIIFKIYLDRLLEEEP